MTRSLPLRRADGGRKPDSSAPPRAGPERATGHPADVWRRPIGGLFAPVGDDTAQATLQAAWSAGVRAFDTAPHYGAGLSESRLGKYLAARPRAEYILSTKVGRLLIRPPGPLGDTEGFYGAPPLARVRDYSPDGVLVAGRYSLLDTSAGARLLPECRRRGVAVLAGGVFNSGILADPRPGARYDYQPASPELIARAGRIARVCARHGLPIGAVALHFTLRHPAVTAAVVGARSPTEISEDIQYLGTAVPDSVFDELAHEGLLPASTAGTR